MVGWSAVLGRLFSWKGLWWDIIKYHRAGYLFEYYISFDIYITMLSHLITIRSKVLMPSK